MGEREGRREHTAHQGGKRDHREGLGGRPVEKEGSGRFRDKKKHNPEDGVTNGLTREEKSREG